MVAGTRAPGRNPSVGDNAAVLGEVVPSNAKACSGANCGPAPRPSHSPPMRPAAMPQVATRAMPLDIRIARLLSRGARMGERALTRRSHLLGVFPQITGAEFFRP